LRLARREETAERDSDADRGICRRRVWMANGAAATHAMDILELLGRHAAPMPAAAISEAVGLPRSSTYHLLGLLCERGYVLHLPEERRYGLGVAAFELGSAYTRQEPLRWVARTVLTELVEETGQNGHFAVLHDRDVLYVIEERVPGRPSLVTDVGVRLPAQLTASGLAMLAALRPRQLRVLFGSRRELVRRNGAGPQSLAELDRLLGDVRRTGFAQEHGYVTPGFASVAAAVLDHSGHPAAAVALTFREDEVDSRRLAALAERASASAALVAQRIHGRFGDRLAQADDGS
jgi:DNA-binding IclR family transcriptional regulator